MLWGCLELVSLRILQLLDLLRRSVMAALSVEVHLSLMTGGWQMRVHDRASIYDELRSCDSRFDIHYVHGLRELLHLVDTLLVGLNALLEGSKRL